MTGLLFFLFSIQANASSKPSHICDQLSITENEKPHRLVLKGHCTKDPIEATTYYHKASNSNAFCALGERHYLMGNYSLAISYFKKTKKTGVDFQIQDENPTAMSPTTQATLDYWISLSHFASGNRKSAEKILKKLLKSRVLVCEVGFDCVASGGFQSQAPVVGTLVRVLDYKRRWTQATRILERYFKKKDQSSIRWTLDLRLMLGNFYFRLQKTKKAYLQFARILRFYPQSAQSHWLRDHYAYAEILKKYGSKVSSIQ